MVHLELRGSSRVAHRSALAALHPRLRPDKGHTHTHSGGEALPCAPDTSRTRQDKPT